MTLPQAELDHHLDQQHTIRVDIFPDYPLPENNVAYAPLRTLVETGFTFTPRELIHAIGCKTLALPINARDESAQYALLYTHILDLEGDHLTFRGDYESDLKTARSQEVGIAFMCLIAQRYLGIPWDQLGALPGRGKRFDYRGVGNGLQCILEAKGTAHLENQKSQIVDGLEKKESHHQNGEHFDVELIVSSYIGWNNGAPRIVLADPDKSSLRELYDRGDARYYRLKHYCRVLQYIGLPESAYRLYQYAQSYLNNRQSVYKTIMDEKSRRGFLTSITVGDDIFLGRWFTNWLPQNSKRYQKLKNKDKRDLLKEPARDWRVFQGVRHDLYESGFDSDPFSHKLLDVQETKQYKRFDKAGVSVFSDGTIMIFQQR